MRLGNRQVQVYTKGKQPTPTLNDSQGADVKIVVGLTKHL